MISNGGRLSDDLGHRVGVRCGRACVGESDPVNGTETGHSRPLRVLVTGWSGVLHGEATAGDVLSMAAVTDALTGAGLACDTGWSAVMCPPGGLRLADADPAAYTHLVWACGPLSGEPVAATAARFAGCRRIAVGVSVLDPDDPAVAAFDTVIARDSGGADGLVDLAARTAVGAVPVVAVFLTSGQQEYGGRRRHEDVNALLGRWLGSRDLARLDLDTRLDPRDWRLAATPAQVESVVRRVDAVVTTRLHGLVLGLKNGVPAVAVDPVAGGAKVTAQARAWDWPVLAAETLTAAALDVALDSALSGPGRAAARRVAASAPAAGAGQLDALLAALGQARNGTSTASSSAERTSGIP